MPTLIIQTNAMIAPDERPPLLKAASALVADMLGKPERYVMVILDPTPEMCFGGDMAPLAYLELKSLGLPEERCKDFSAALCGFIAERLKVPADRVYIEFASPPRHMFGFNAGTFG
jgi:phenylpyruvate tautomerase PptA (4-oxalocrotonate tautomerase family)